MGVIETVTFGERAQQTLSFAGQLGGSVIAVGTERGVCIFDAERSRSAVELTEIGGRKLGPVSQCAIDSLKLRVALLLGKSEIVALVADL
jgi:hypothetical protein